MSKKYKVAIVGSSGLVGRTVLKVLEGKNFNNVTYTLFSSKNSAGNKINFLGEDYILCELKEDSFENIMASDKAKAVMEKVNNCNRNCAFIVTERHDMVRRPWIPIKWVLKNKWRIYRGKDICWD